MVTACSYTETVWIPRLPGLRVVRTPMGAAARGALERTLEGGEVPALILSTGFCGGLVSSLRPGKVVLASEVYHRGETLPIDATLLGQAKTGLAKKGIDFTVGAIESAEHVVQTAKEKSEVAKEGAIAVEMEGGPLSRLARERGIGFLSVKAVLDPADCTLPFASGRSLLRSILAHPVATLRFAWLSFRAGRAIGRAIPAVVGALGD